jgi:hypothetical protein
VGLSLLCALVFSAFAASSASAFGTTAFTCKKQAAGVASTFSDEHCTKAVVGTGGWKHEPIALNTKTAFTASNEKTELETTKAKHATLNSKIGGLETEITCTTVTAEGFLTNETPGGAGTEMVNTGSEIVIHYSGCTVPKPAGQNCKIKEGKITTNKLKSTTAGKGDKIEFKPEAGTTFVPITFEGCKTVELSKTYPVEGSVLAIPNGATLETTEAQVTTDNTLTFGGQKAGLTSSTTVRMKEGEPIAMTTE